MPQHPHICMLAAENDMIPGAKVGGIGDVIRDIPRALAREGASVSVIIPAYSAFHRLPGANKIGTTTISFAGETDAIELYELFLNRDPGVRYLVLHHVSYGECGAGKVYCNDPDDRPFATDATKFAHFCASALQCIVDDLIGSVDLLHLHDWHSSFAAILREFDPRYQQLKSIRCVLSIHNLAMQGVRPLHSDESSLSTWYPELHTDINKIVDPRWDNCVNPLAAAIRLVDKVHTVSPSYSLEIIQPNAPERGFHGGEGLERDLQQCAARDALVGIVNGIEYTSSSEESPTQKLEWQPLLNRITSIILGWLAESDTVSTTDYVAHVRTQQWLIEKRPTHVFTSVGRLTDQKMALLMRPTTNNNIVLDDLLVGLQGRGVFILLGSGDPHLEALCRRSASKHTNFLFLNRYAQELSDLLFANGDVFLMPSSFEPCGISQMLAMNQAQPCIVHAVGGLRDTVSDMEDGFHFEGATVNEQVENLQQCINKVINMREHSPEQFEKIAENAYEKRFLWSNSAQQYINELYQ